MATAAEITQTFTAAQIAVETAQIERLAEGLRSYGSLENLIAALAVDCAEAEFKVALTYQRALRDVNDPSLIITRLRTHAADLREQAARSAEDAAGYLKMARGRLDAGNADSIYRNLLASYRAAARQSGDLIKRALAATDEAARVELEAVQAETGRLTASNSSMKAA